MVNKRMHTGDIVSPDSVFGELFPERWGTILQAAFEHSFFLDPDKVRVKTPYFSDRARYSREHYPACKEEISLLGMAMVGAFAWMTIRLHNGLGGHTRNARCERGSGYVTFGDILGIPVHSRPVESLLYAILGGPADRKSSIPIRHWRRLCVRLRGISTFERIPYVIPPDFVENPGMDLTWFLVSSLF